MIKKIDIKPKDKNVRVIDNWVSNRKIDLENKKNMKRLTIDISEDLHTKIKKACYNKGLKMSDEVRRVLQEEFDK
jgi:predicted DNA binding CopG/RHH family protein